MHRRQTFRVIAGLALCPLCTRRGSAAETDWSYQGTNDGPAKWGDLDSANRACSAGVQQSPIDIGETIKAQLPPLKMAWARSAETIVNTGRTIQLNMGEGSVLSAGVGLGGVAAVLNDSDPEFSRALRQALNESLARIERLVTADVATGRLAPDLDPDILVNLIVGAYLGEVLRYGRVRRDWLERTAELLLVALTPR